MRKARILIDDKLGRWGKGEVGKILKNDFDKYDYYLELEPVQNQPRLFYFFAEEVEEVITLKPTSANNIAQIDKPVMTDREKLDRIAEIIESVDNRCMAADGPVLATLEEMRQDEISEIYSLSKRG